MIEFDRNIKEVRWIKLINGHDIPALNFFENKNIYTGSEGKNFRFRIENKDGSLDCCVWNEDICYELCTVSAEKSFELSSDGLCKAVDWVFEQKN